VPRKFFARAHSLEVKGGWTMIRSSKQPEDASRNRKEPEAGTESHEAPPIDRRDPNAPLPFAEQLRISDLQLWIDLCA
jgi:hypothetical protein